MSEGVNTHYLKGGFASSDEVVLSVEPRTRIVFRPGLHGGGVNGEIIRQKIGKDGQWADLSEVDFRSLPSDAGVTIKLNTEATTTLATTLAKLYRVQKQGIDYGDQRYVVGKAEEVVVVNDNTKRAAIKGILDKGYSEEFWETLVAADPDLASRLSYGQVHMDRMRIVEGFEEAIKVHPGDETTFWQGFFEAHPWILETALSASAFMLRGETYLGGKRPIGRNGEGGVATDYLFGDASTKSFLVVEIKTPGAKLVGGIYRGEKDTGEDSEIYSMSGDLSGALVQVKTQVAVAIEHFQSVLGLAYSDSLNRIHPKGVLLTGLLKNLTGKQMDSFNHFRSGYGEIDIITFDEVLNRIKKVYGMKYTNIAATTNKTTINKNSQ